MQIVPRILRFKVTSISTSTRLMSTKINQELLLVSTKNNVTCLTMNNPKKLNGWTLAMLDKLLPTMENLSKDDNTKVVILTGTDPYYSAGSSVHFERILGKEAADKMLKRGEKITATEAKDYGLVLDVVPHEQLMVESQVLAENWISQGKKRTIPGGQDVLEYKAVNRRESVEVADAFLSYNFLDNQTKFLKSKGKLKEARIFWILKSLRPLWSKLL